MTKIIADACCNHLGSRKLIEQMIYKAKEVGIDIIKFQSFQADKLNRNWKDFNKWYEYYKSVELSDEDHLFILDKCKEVNIEPLFTVFDTERVDFLYQIGMRQVKIASPDMLNYDLHNKCFSKNLYVMISTGMHKTDVVDQVRCDQEDTMNQACFFYCVSKYPTPIEEINFDRMALFPGFSDHTLGIEAAKKAIDLDLVFIEKHFTLGRDLPGKDQKISATVEELKQLVEYRDYVKKCKNYKTRWINE